jgi:nitrite reductase/ring-hydroxylating ferredoxin subunit
MRILLLTLLALVTFTWTSSCQKQNLHPVPNIAFNTNININLPSYSGLQNIGGYAYVPNIGSKGVVVYRKTLEEFMAFDRHSPAEGGNDCDPLILDAENSLLVVDVCSGAKFSLIDGSIVEGPSEFPLRMYRTVFDGAYTLNISN